MQVLAPVFDDLKGTGLEVCSLFAAVVAAVRDGDPGADSSGAVELLSDVRHTDRVPGLQAGAGVCEVTVGGFEAVPADAGEPVVLADFPQYDRDRDLEDRDAAVLRGRPGAAAERGAEAVLQAQRAEPGVSALFSVVDRAGRDHAGDAGFGGRGEPAAATAGCGAADHLFGEQPDVCADAGRQPSVAAGGLGDDPVPGGADEH